jgi:class I fructose-bisphosphate aldolase
VVQASFNGKRIVIFSGGATKGTDALVEELKQIHKGGGFGTIMGRNAFQRNRAEGAALLKTAIQIFGRT